jgi:hypothetical protein
MAEEEERRKWRFFKEVACGGEQIYFLIFTTLPLSHSGYPQVEFILAICKNDYLARSPRSSRS